MADGITIELKGWEELTNALSVMEPKVANSILRPALREGAKRIQKDAKTRVPVAGKLDPWLVSHGYSRRDLQRSIKVRAGKRKKGQVSVRVVSMLPGLLYYGAQVEYGTSKQKSQAYMRPAFDKNREGVLRVIEQKLRTGLDNNWQQQAAALMDSGDSE